MAQTMGGGGREIVPTAGDVAVALVTACGLLGANPAEAMTGAGSLSTRARTLAAAGLRLAGKASTKMVLRVCRISNPVGLAPSQLVRCLISEAMVQQVAKALGWTPPADPSPDPARAPPCEIRVPTRLTGPTPEQRYAHTGGRRGIVRLKPVTPEIQRWAGFFAQAGWPRGEVAELFDVDEAHLPIARGGAEA